jgi:hypothetical protein
MEEENWVCRRPTPLNHYQFAGWGLNARNENCAANNKFKLTFLEFQSRKIILLLKQLIKYLLWTKFIALSWVTKSWVWIPYPNWKSQIPWHCFITGKMNDIAFKKKINQKTWWSNLRPWIWFSYNDDGGAVSWTRERKPTAQRKQLALNGQGSQGGDTRQTSRTWIKFSKPLCRRPQIHPDGCSHGWIQGAKFQSGLNTPACAREKRSPPRHRPPADAATRCLITQSSQIRAGQLFLRLHWAEFFPSAQFAEIAPSYFFASFNFSVFESFPNCFAPQPCSALRVICYRERENAIASMQMTLSCFIYFLFSVALHVAPFPFFSSPCCCFF